MEERGRVGREVGWAATKRAHQQQRRASERPFRSQFHTHCRRQAGSAHGQVCVRGEQSAEVPTERNGGAVLSMENSSGLISVAFGA